MEGRVPLIVYQKRMALTVSYLGNYWKFSAYTEEFFCLGKTAYLLKRLTGRQIVFVGRSGMIYAERRPESQKWWSSSHRMCGYFRPTGIGVGFHSCVSISSWVYANMFWNITVHSSLGTCPEQDSYFIGEVNQEGQPTNYYWIYIALYFGLSELVRFVQDLTAINNTFHGIHLWFSIPILCWPCCLEIANGFKP